MEPYYIVPDIERYRSLNPDSDEARKLARKIAANIGDFASLRLILGIDPPEFARFYPDMDILTPGTNDTIDSFLDKYGGNGEPIGYMAGINEEEIGIVKEIEKGPEVKEPTLQELIKSKRYKEASEFIERENLNNTQKSIYFAHQIRFLKKLEAIEKYRNKHQG